MHNKKREGFWIYFETTGDTAVKGYFKNGEQDSTWTYYYDSSSTKLRECHYKNNLRNGLCTIWYRNGQIERAGKLFK